MWTKPKNPIKVIKVGVKNIGAEEVHKGQKDTRYENVKKTGEV